MAIYTDTNKKIKSIFADINGKKKPISSVWVNKNGVPAKVFSRENASDPKIVSWSDGTDEEIAKMLEAHYTDLINIADYWNVGDTRNINLDGTNYSFVILDFNHDSLSIKNPSETIKSKSKAAVSVQMADCLTSTYKLAPDNTKRVIGLGDLENLFTNMLNIVPTTIASLIKWVYDPISGVANKLWLPTENEVFGVETYSSSYYDYNNSQYQYYKTPANRVKKIGTQKNNWWLRSEYEKDQHYHISVDSNGNVSYDSVSSSYGVSFGFSI